MSCESVFVTVHPQGWALVKLLLLVGILLAFGAATVFTPWTARAGPSHHTWIIDLGTHPLWDPPAAPDHVGFRGRFSSDRSFPPAHAAGIRVEPDLSVVIAIGTAFSSVPFLVCGVLHRRLRCVHQDIVLHCSLWIGLFLPLGLLSCCCLAPPEIGIAALIAAGTLGAGVGAATFRPGKRY